MTELSGSTALVTGGASGMGRATVLRLLAAGASVAAGDRDEAFLDDLEAEISRDGHEDRFLRVVTDVTNEESLESFVEQTTVGLGAPDILVTAAGIQHYGDIAQTSRADWDRVFAVNVTGAFLSIAAALPSLRASGRGSVVVVSSVQGTATQRGVAAYTASKGALGALVRSAAVDEAQFGVRVNAVLPGSVDTPMLRASARKFSDGSSAGEQRLVEEWGRSHPLGRVALASEIAEAIVFLASPRASFITGASIPVDGGLLAALAVGLPE